MQVLRGTYKISLWDFLTKYNNIIKNLEYTVEELYDCIDMINNGILQSLKLYVINGELKSGCKLIAIANDFLNNKIADRSGRYFKEYSDEERFYLSHIVKFDYMEIMSEDNSKVQRLVDLISFSE